MFNRCQPAAYPAAAAFAVAVQYAGQGGRAMPRRRKGACHSLRAALVASGASPARVASKLGLAYALHCNGLPLAWPRGFAPR